MFRADNRRQDAGATCTAPHRARRGGTEAWPFVHTKPWEESGLAKFDLGPVPSPFLARADCRPSDRIFPLKTQAFATYSARRSRVWLQPISIPARCGAAAAVAIMTFACIVSFVLPPCSANVTV